MVASMNIHDVTDVKVASTILTGNNGPSIATTYEFFFKDYQGVAQSITITIFHKEKP